MISKENRYSQLADFLKTRRAKLLPNDVGLAETSHRRTPGLRREEVAQLAGVSITWYTWLEQGREIQVSTQVLESLSRALLLSPQESTYLYYLANQPIPFHKTNDVVSPMFQHVLDSLEYSPSLVIDRFWSVIAWNRAACILFGDFTCMNAYDRNIVWAMFMDKSYQTLIVDWEKYARALVAKFRYSCSPYMEEPWISQLIENLKIHSEEFCSFWSLHEIEQNAELYKQLNHKQLGSLDFEVCKFEEFDHPSLKMIVHTPANDMTKEKIAGCLYSISE